MDPPLHDVNSRQHNAGVGTECQCRRFILSLPLPPPPPFFFPPLSPAGCNFSLRAEGNFPLGDMDLVKDRPV